MRHLFDPTQSDRPAVDAGRKVPAKSTPDSGKSRYIRCAARPQHDAGFVPSKRLQISVIK